MRTLLIILFLSILFLSYGQINSRTFRNNCNNANQIKNGDIIELYKLSDENKISDIEDSGYYLYHGLAWKGKYRVWRVDINNYYNMQIGIWRFFFRNGKTSDSIFFSEKGFDYKWIRLYKDGKINFIMMRDSLTSRFIDDTIFYGNDFKKKYNRSGKILYEWFYTKSTNIKEWVYFNKEGIVRKRKSKINK